MWLSTPLAAFVMAALMSLSFLCALAETALFSLGRWQIRRMQEAGGTALQAAGLLEHPEELLSSLSLANNLANGMFVVTVLTLSSSHDWNLWIALPLAFVGILMIGEILPKTLAVRAPERWAARSASGVHLLHRVARPIQQLFRKPLDTLLHRIIPGSFQPLPFTDEEYRELLEMGVQQGALAHSEKEIIAELITLDRKCARDVLRPRATMASVSDAVSGTELVDAARRLRHRRLPIYDESPDTIVGVLNAQQFLLDPDHEAESAIEFPSFVPETINLLQLFQALQRQKRNLAIVLDEFGTVTGVVRMEDILAEVLGNMSAENTTRGFVFEKLGVGRWRASGSMRLEDFRREYPALPEVADTETLGGLMLAQLDIVPPHGASATIHGLRLTATEVDERRIREILVETVSGR